MSRDLERTRNICCHALFMAVGLLAWSGTNNAAELGTNAADETYTWHAELVEFDESTQTVTVKSRVVDKAGIDSLSDLSDGDRVVLTWSGLSWATGIRSIAPHTDNERMTLPVEFVASVMDGQYVEFRVPVPSDNAAKIASLTPGQWVTATSPHRPSDWEHAISSIRAFTEVT